MNIENFQKFTNNILQDNTLTRYNNNDHCIHILDAYTTFTMCDKNNRKKIHEYRKEWFVNSYIANNCNVNTEDKQYLKDSLLNYYENNLNDPFTGNFQPPSSIYLQELFQNKKEHDDFHENDDVVFHYTDLSNRYSRYLQSIKEKLQKLEAVDNDICNESDDHSICSDDEYMDYDTNDYDYEDFDYDNEYYEEDCDDYNDW